MNHSVTSISVQDLKQQMNESDICLVDVREMDEWEEVHIPEAIHIPLGQLEECVHLLPNKKDQPIFLHCRGGKRSLRGGEQLLALGYQNVYSIEGGIVAWIAAGYPIQD